MTRLIFRHREREEKQKQVDFSETKILKLLNCKLIDMQMLGALQTLFSETKSGSFSDELYLSGSIRRRSWPKQELKRRGERRR